MEKMMMDYVSEVMENLQKLGYSCEKQSVAKNNGVEKIGIKIDDNSKMQPIIYIDDYYNTNTPVQLAVEQILEKITNKKPIEGIAEINAEYVYSHVKFQLVNKKKNQELLKTLPHFDYLDLACIYVIEFLGDNKGYAKLTNDTVEFIRPRHGKLYEVAYANTGDFTAESFVEILGLPDDMPFLCITNKEAMYGASCLLYPKLFRDISEKLDGGDLYILPSSIHEVIALPVSFTDDVSALKQMVMEVNGDVVSETEYLSDSIYRYCNANGKIVVEG